MDELTYCLTSWGDAVPWTVNTRGILTGSDSSSLDGSLLVTSHMQFDWDVGQVLD